MRTHEAGVLHADVSQPNHVTVPQPNDLAALAPAVWSRNVSRNAIGSMRLAGMDVRELAREFGTPAYLCDEADFRARAQAFRAVFSSVSTGQSTVDDDVAVRGDVHYAAKSFCCTDVLRWIAEDGLDLDVCTAGELAVAQRADFPPSRITMHGNNKSPAELSRAVAYGVGQIVLDCFEEIDRLARVAREQGVRQRVLIRATVGVEAHTHEFIATAHEDQKFGFSLADGDALAAARRVLEHEELELVGVHSHIGSQIFDTSGFEISARRAVGLLANIRRTLGITLPYLNLGGGFGIAYVEGDDPLDPASIALQLQSIVASECAAVDLPMPRIGIEPGRAIAGPATFTLYEVGVIKPIKGIRTYVSVDGGMSDNIRTALYDAAYTCVLASRTSNAKPMLARVVGKHCESGDIVVRDTWLPSDVVPGDLLAVAATGAYCRSMASNYNHVPRPPVVAVRNGQARLMVRRETEDDLMRLDVTTVDSSANAVAR